MKKCLSLFAVLLTAISLQAQTVTAVGDHFYNVGLGDQTNYSYNYRVTALPSGSTPGKLEITGFTRSGVYVSYTQVVLGAFELNYNGAKKPFIVTRIGETAFQSHAALQDLVLVYNSDNIPSSIEIGVAAFKGCENLSAIYAGSGEYTGGAWKKYPYAKFGNVGSSAFYGCKSLSMTVTCGEAIKNGGTNLTYSIGANAFYNCSKVNFMTCGGSNIDKTAFTGCTGITILAWLGGNASITSESESPFYMLRDNTMWVAIYGSVPAYYFRNCKGITYISMPDDIWSYVSYYNTSVGAYAFAGCTGLLMVNIGGKVDGNAFYGADAITSVIWRGGDPGITAPNMSIFRSSADKITSFKFESTSAGCSVPDYICCGLTKIKNVTIPANTAGKIGKCAFQECSALESVDFDGDFDTYYPEIGNFAFYKCSALKTITTNKTEGLPKMIYKIGNNAFASCTALTTGLSEKNTNISEIGTNAFYSSGIEKLVIPASTWTISMGKEIAGGYNSKVTEIDYLYTGQLTRANAGGSYANVFLSANSSYQSYRNKVTKLVINKEVKNIPDSLFYNYQGIAAINDQNGATTVSGVEKIGVASFYNCKALTTFKSKALTTIGESAFENSGFESSVFNTVQMNAVTTIGDKAFKNTKVKSFVSNGHTNYVTSLTKIGKEAFANCSQLEQVTIPAEVTSIGTDAFAGCSALKTIYWNAKDFGSSNPFGSTIAAQITALTISDDVTKIPADFLVGSQIKNITFPTGIKTIGARAFKNTASLDSISFLAYNGQVEVSVSSASDAPFAGSSLKIAYMPQSITTVPSWLLAGTSKLEKMYVSASAPSFASNALNGAGLKELSLTNVQNIGSKSFANMTALKTIYLNGSVPTPKSDSFSGTNNVQTIVASCANYSEVYNSSTWTAVCSNITNSESKFSMKQLKYMLGLTWSDGSPMDDDGFWTFNGKVVIESDLSCDGKVTIRVDPYDGYEFLYWRDNGSLDNPREFDLNDYSLWFIGGQCVSEADWHQQYFSIVPEDAGYITATNEYGHNRDNLRFVKDEEAVLKAVVTNEWYEFKEWQWDQNAMSSPMIGDPNNWEYEGKDMCYFYIRYMDGMGGMEECWDEGMQMMIPCGESSVTQTPEHDEYVKAVCAVRAIDVAIEPSTNGGGSIEFEAGAYKTGDEITVTAKPAEGYIFKEWGNHSTEATIKLTIDAKDLKKRFLMGSDPETGEPMFDYQPVWNGSNLEPYDPAGEYIYEVYAVFEADPNYKKTYTITVETLDPAKGTVSGGGDYEEGTQVTLTATPNEGYQFSVWSDGVAANPRVITVTKDDKFTALFTEKTIELPQFTITVSSSNEEWGTVAGGGVYEQGQTIQIYANAADGYKFVRWQEDENTDNPRTVVVTGDLTLTAEFAKIGEGVEDVEGSALKARKVMIDGVIYIIKGDKRYNLLGAEVK